MTRDKLEALSKKDLADMARKKGVAGYSTLRKDQRIAARAPESRKTRVKSKAARPRPRPQASAARNTSATSSGEEVVERSKFDVGVPTRDLSAKVPKELPAGYGKDRIIVMVRD